MCKGSLKKDWFQTGPSSCGEKVNNLPNIICLNCVSLSFHMFVTRFYSQLESTRGVAALVF